MPIRKILLYPEDEAVLRKECEPVEVMNRNVRRLVQDLKDTLRQHQDGVGLSAPQISAHQRVLVVRLGTDEGPQKERSRIVALINPVIHAQGNEQRDFDGCLSFPGLYGETVRPHFLRISGMDERGEPFEREFHGFDAVVVHHEIDHLDGVLFIDRIEQIEDLYRLVENEQGHLVRVPLSVTPSQREDHRIAKKGRG